MGESDKIVKCIYWNVCKALDENFHKVVCGLWPKDNIQAPHSNDAIAPVWTVPEPLAVLVRSGNIRLSWKQATDNEAIMGYEVWRSDDAGASFSHIYSITTSMWTDHLAASGIRYQYYIRAYDLAGNKSAPSNVVPAELPLEVALPAEAKPIARLSFLKSHAPPVVELSSTVPSVPVQESLNS